MATSTRRDVVSPCLASADPSVTGEGCALRRVLDAVGGKWKILLLVALSQADELRYGELRRLVFGITNTMLAGSLRELEADGLVAHEHARCALSQGAQGVPKR